MSTAPRGEEVKLVAWRPSGRRCFAGKIMKTAILLTAAVLLMPCVSSHAQAVDPYTAYYAGQEEQRELDSDRQSERQIQEMQNREEEKRQADAERFNREADDSVREEQLQRMRNELTDMQTQQMLRQPGDEPR